MFHLFVTLNHEFPAIAQDNTHSTPTARSDMLTKLQQLASKLPGYQNLYISKVNYPLTILELVFKLFLLPQGIATNIWEIEEGNVNFVWKSYVASQCRH